MIDLELIARAREWLAGRILETPVEESPVLGEILGVPVHLKLEFLQITGSFKFRGALFSLSRLPEAEKGAGVATCSAGNHGWAMARAGKELGVRTTIFVPESVDQAKFQGMVGLGAEVVRSRFPGYDATQAWALEEAARRGLPFISAFDDDPIMAANGGTLAAEICGQLPGARNFILPVGGGGMAAGLSFYAKEKYPDARLIGCQHEGSPGLALSLKRGRAVTSLPPLETAAGGVEGGLGERAFEVLRERTDQVALVSEAEILEALRWMLREHRCLIEPSAAVPVAACLNGRVGPLEDPAVVVLSGRNVAYETIRAVIAGAG